MENRNRTVLVVLVAIVFVVAVFSSFGLNLFGTTPEVYFPAPRPTGSVDPNQGGQTTEPDHFLRVEVTPESVQNIIDKTLRRPENYYREISVSTFRADGTEDAQTSRVWASGGWTRTETALPNGRTQLTLVGEGTVYRWYGSEGPVRSWPAEDRSADLEGQRIPTYEDVLALAREDITAAGYETRGTLTCIYVETAENDLGYQHRYWVSVENGLLTEAEIWEGERLLYRMTTLSLEQGVTADLTLPDGTTPGAD